MLDGRRAMASRIAFNAGTPRKRMATRRGVRLVYPHRYFVGEAVATPKPPVTGADSIKKLLMKDGCYYPEAALHLVAQPPH